jgi:hypothetical protein
VTPSGSVWYVQRARVTPDAQFRQIWVTVDHSQDRTISYTRSRILVVLECAARRYHLESLTSIAADGSITDEGGGPSRTENIAPDTIMESVWRIACPTSR